jgi:hypothetical protein
MGGGDTREVTGGARDQWAVVSRDSTPLPSVTIDASYPKDGCIRLKLSTGATGALRVQQHNHGRDGE